MPLTSGDWAAWVQAIGTIIAILAAAWIARWQFKKQHQSALLLHKAEQRYTRIEQAKSLLTLCHSCMKAVKHFTGQMNDRETVHKIADREIYLDFGELQSLENALVTIPLYSLPVTSPQLWYHAQS